MSNKGKLIQLIHIGKAQLQLDDESYRLMIKRLTNKTSSTKCTVVELLKVLHEMQQKGAKVKYFARKPKTLADYSPATGESRVKSQIVHKIRAVWITMGKQGFLRDASEKALNAYMRKVINKNQKVLMLNVNALSPNDASRFLEILKKWHRRVMLESLVASGETIANPKISYDHLLDYYNEKVMIDTMMKKIF